MSVSLFIASHPYGVANATIYSISSALGDTLMGVRRIYLYRFGKVAPPVLQSMHASWKVVAPKGATTFRIWLLRVGRYSYIWYIYYHFFKK